MVWSILGKTLTITWFVTVMMVLVEYVNVLSVDRLRSSLVVRDGPSTSWRPLLEPLRAVSAPSLWSRSSFTAASGSAPWSPAWSPPAGMRPSSCW